MYVHSYDLYNLYINTYTMSCICVHVHILYVRRWLSDVHGIFYQANKKKQIPSNKLEAIFEAASVMMSSQLRELVINSVSSYQHMYSPVSGEAVEGIFPGFVIHIAIDGITMQFEPCQKDFEVCIHVHVYVFESCICFCTLYWC